MMPLARDPSRRSTYPVMPAMHLVGPYLPDALIAATPVTNSVSPSDFSSSGPSARYISRACPYSSEAFFDGRTGAVITVALPSAAEPAPEGAAFAGLRL